MEIDDKDLVDDLTRKCSIIIGLSTILGTDEETESSKILSHEECMKRLKISMAAGKLVSQNPNKAIVTINEDIKSVITKFAEPIRAKPMHIRTPESLEFKEEVEKINDDIKDSQMLGKLSESLTDVLTLNSADFETHVDVHPYNKTSSSPLRRAIRKKINRVRRSSKPFKPMLGRKFLTKSKLFNTVSKPADMSLTKLLARVQLKKSIANNKNTVEVVVKEEPFHTPRKRKLSDAA